ncbi:unnamed protein product [Knipowitschia caucasica]
MWTSRSTEAYLTVTCHFVHNWQMVEYVLEASPFTEKHTAANISSALKRITDDWGIRQKVIAVITDNGANVVAAVNMAGWTHYPCFAHTLNLVVKDAIKAVPEIVNLVKKCSNIVGYFHHSSKATEKLVEIQKQLNKPEHKLIQSVETRWNSAFYMLARLEEQKEAVTTVLCLIGRNDLCLGSEEVDLIHPTIEALRPFEEATIETSASKHVSMSKVIPLVSVLLKATAATEHQENILSRQLLFQCQRRFHSIETFYGIGACTFLDIRFRNIAFRNKDNLENVKRRILAEMKENQLVPQAASSVSNCASSTPPAPTPPAPTPAAPTPAAPQPTSSSTTSSVRGIWADFDTQAVSSQQHRTAATDALIELRHYLEEKIIPRDHDPLQWWKDHTQAFPFLSRLASKYLGIVASSVPSERIFSKTGELISQRRNRLKGKNVNMLLFLNKNLGSQK